MVMFHSYVYKCLQESMKYVEPWAPHCYIVILSACLGMRIQSSGNTCATLWIDRILTYLYIYIIYTYYTYIYAYDQIYTY